MSYKWKNNEKTLLYQPSDKEMEIISHILDAFESAQQKADELEIRLNWVASFEKDNSKQLEIIK